MDDLVVQAHGRDSPETALGVIVDGRSHLVLGPLGGALGEGEGRGLDVAHLGEGEVEETVDHEGHQAEGEGLAGGEEQEGRPNQPTASRSRPATCPRRARRLANR